MPDSTVVTLAFASTITAVETVGTTPAAATANARVTHDQFNEAAALTSATTPPVTKCAYFEQALSGGGATIDLTALTGSNGGAVNGTGLKVQAFRMKNVLGNSAMSITFGGSNPYSLAGADFKVTLLAGQHFTFYGNDATPDIASNACEMDLAGSGVEKCEISIVMG